MISLFFIFALSLMGIYYAGKWKAFEKAGEPGWAAIVPFYNYWVTLRIADKPDWWFALLFIPGINVAVILLTLMSLARNYGKGEGFGVGLAFLGLIFWPILGFGDAQYQLRDAPVDVPNDIYMDPDTEYEVEEWDSSDYLRN